MNNINIGINGEFEYKEILFKGSLSYENKSLNIIAELISSEDTLGRIIDKISSDFYTLIKSAKLQEILDVKLNSLVLARYKNCEYFLVSIDEGIVGIQINNGFAGFISLDFNRVSFSILNDILKVINKLVSIKSFTLAFSSSNLSSLNSGFLKELISIDDKSYKKIPDISKSKHTSIELSKYGKYINDSKVLFVSEIEIKEDSLLGKALANSFSSDLNILIAVSNMEVKAMLMLQLNIKDTLKLDGCLFIRSTGMIGIDGHINLKVNNKTILFSIDAIITFDSVSISGTYNDILDFGAIRLENLGLAIGYSIEGLPVFGVKANMFIPAGESDFHTFFCIYYDNEKSMISGAMSDISITSIIKYLTNSKIDMNFEILKIGALVPSIEGKRKILNEDLENKNFDKISEIFKKEYSFDLDTVSKDDCLSIQVDRDSRNNNIWYLSDNIKAKHYVIKNGIPSIEAQFYFSTTEMSFGEYNIYPGVFVACRLIIMDKIIINTLVDINKDKGIRILVNVNEINLPFLKIKKSDKETVFMKKVEPPDMLKQFVDKNNNGPLFYLSTYADERALFFSSHVEIFSLIKADALIKFQGRTFLFNLEYEFFGIKTIINANADFENLWNGCFEIGFAIDVNDFYKTFNEITEQVSSFFKNKVKDIQALIDKIKYAQDSLAEYDRQIADREAQIRNLRGAINNTPWYKSYMIPYYLGQIAFIEAEILAIEGYKEGQRLILKAAEGALELAKGISSDIGSIINKISSVVNWSVHLNRLEMSVTAKSLDKLMFNFMTDCTFLGQNKVYKFTSSVDTRSMLTSIAKAIKDYIIDKLKNALLTSSNLLPYKNINRTPFILGAYNKNLVNSNDNVTNTLSLLNKTGEIYINIYQYEYHEHNENVNDLKIRLNNHKYILKKIDDYHEGLEIEEAIKEIEDNYRNYSGGMLKNNDYSKFSILQERVNQAQDILKTIKQNENLTDMEELIYKKDDYSNGINLVNENEDKAFSMLQAISAEAEKIEEFNEGIFYELMGDAYNEKKDKNSARLQYDKAIDMYNAKYDNEKISTIKDLYKKSIENVENKIQNL